MPPIDTDKNTNYGPPLVSQKYSPLLNIQYVAIDQPFYSGLLTYRHTVLNNLGLVPRPLQLQWIRAGINYATAELQRLGLPAFTTASDLRALCPQNNQATSPPIYIPTRAGPNRNIYIVVHSLEYVDYRLALAGTGITVVGWDFENNAHANGLWLSGFGPSRFAAIQFCKELRAAAANAAGGVAPWGLAWLFDDNAVAMTNFAGFLAVEATMTPAHACAGFQGGTKAETTLTNRAYAQNELANGRGQQVNVLPPSAPPGILQQAVLWNIAYLDNQHLNFGLIYLESAEDMSIGNYFDRQHTPYLYYAGITVRKEETFNDPGEAGRDVNAARHRLSTWITDAEATNPLPPPPPPVNVQPAQQADGGLQPIGDFVVNRVLPNSGLSQQAGNPVYRSRAKCQAVEQVTCGAISRGFVSANALNTTFRINGANPQRVQRLSL